MNVNLLSSKWFQTAQGYKDVGQTKDVRGQGKCNTPSPLTRCSTTITWPSCASTSLARCVDLVYLDPPFNSNRNYNVLFKDVSGKEAEAQIEAVDREAGMCCSQTAGS